MDDNTFSLDLVWKILKLHGVPEIDQEIIQIAVYQEIGKWQDDYIKAVRRQVAEQPDTNRGKVVVNGASIGGQQRRKLDNDQESAAIALRERLIELGHTKHDACNIVGGKFHVSYKTIERL